MAKTSTNIMRRSIFTFLKNYQHLTSTPILLLLPFAICGLLAPPLVSSSRLLPLVHGRLTSLFLAAGFPPSPSPLLDILNLKLSQTTLASLLVSPLSCSSLLLAKAAVVGTLHHNTNNPSQLYKPLLITQLCNSLLILAANATCFFLLAIFFICLDILGLSSPSSILLLSAVGAILCSIILAHAYIICNLALASSAMEKRGGLMPIIEACLVIKGRSATALSLALPINLALAAIEALFAYRVVGAYNNQALNQQAIILLEGMLIAYLYALTLNLDTVVGCLLWRSFKTDHHIDHDHHDQDFSYTIEIYEFYAKEKV